MAKKNKKGNKQGGVLESSEVLQEEFTRFEHYLETHKSLVFVIVGVVLVAIISILGYRYYISQQDELAQKEMFQAVYYFESDSLDLALNGDGNYLGLLDIIDEYGGTDAANLAEYYAGTAYLLKGNYNTAIEYLGSFSSGDILIQGRAYSLTGDAYMELGNYGKAAEFYNKAANYKPNQHFTPQYLMKAALAYEKLNDYPTAKEMYDRIVEEFFNSSEFQDAKKQSARMQALISS